MEEIPDKEENKNWTQNPALDDDMELDSAYLGEEEFNIWLNAKTTTTNEFHLQHDEKKADLPIKVQLPPEYHEYLDVFDEQKAD